MSSSAADLSSARSPRSAFARRTAMPRCAAARRSAIRSRAVTRTRAQEPSVAGAPSRTTGKRVRGIGVHPRGRPAGEERPAQDRRRGSRRRARRKARRRAAGGSLRAPHLRGAWRCGRPARSAHLAGRGPDDGRVARGRGRGGGGQAIERLTARAISKEAGDHARNDSSASSSSNMVATAATRSLSTAFATPELWKNRGHPRPGPP